MKKTIIKNNQTLFSPKKSLLTLAVSASVAALSMPAHSLSFDLSDEVTVDWDTTVGYTAAWRVSEQDDDLIALSNMAGDDGNKNFNNGSMINNRFSVISEMDVRYQNMGAFVRGSAFYDGAYYGTNDNDGTTSNNISVDGNKFTDATQNAHGNDARLLDAFVYGNFDVADRNLNLRVGRQVVSWGESLFIPGISASMSPADGTKSNVAGVEVKDLLLPVGQVFGQLDITDNFNIAAYYQWEWAKTEMSAAGSFFSTTDLLDEGGESGIAPAQRALVEGGMLKGLLDNLLLDSVNNAQTIAAIQNYHQNVSQSFPNSYSLTRAEDVDASDHGQWGVALNYFAEGLGNGTEFGFYYLNYHEKNPMNIVLTDPYYPYQGVPGLGAIPLGFTKYHLEYFENIKLIGASFGTLIGDTNIGGEVAYRKGTTVLDKDNVGVRADTLQAQLSVIHSFGQTRLADEVMFTGEIGYNEVTDMKESEIRAQDDLYGAGIAGTLTMRYNNVFPATNLEVPVSFRHNIHGKSAAQNFTTSQNSDRVSIGAKFTYQEQFEVGATYNAFFGEADDNVLTDRDNVSLTVKYSF